MHDDWQRIHERLMDLARTQAAHDYEIGRWLLAAARARVDGRLGYGSIYEYGERLFGQPRRVVGDRLRVARALEQLPDLSDALRTGQLRWSAVRELSRVAVAETERAWRDAAGGKTVREIEAMVSGRRPGDRPGDPVRDDDGARRHVLRFEVSATTLALFREAQAKVTRDAGCHLSDDEALTLLARQILGGPADDGRAGYQVAISLCSRCEQATQQASGTDVALDPIAAETAACDAQVVHLTDAAISDRAAPSDRASPSRVAALTHVGTPDRAAQSIPPATRRRVLHRDGGRCVVPGCSHAIVDCHHLRRRADGGDNSIENIITFCTAHHARIHQGTLVVDGSPATGLRFFHADGTVYGGAPAPQAAQAFSEALSGLVGLGFREQQARAALDAVRTGVGAAPTTEKVLIAALACLRPAA